MLRIQNKGFTLIELLITLGITVILGSVGTANYFNYQSSVATEAAAAELTGTLRDARQRAISQDQSSAWGVYINSVADANDYYELFYGDSYAAGTVVSRTTLSTSVQFSVPAQGSTLEINFAKSTGLPSGEYTVSLASVRNSSIAETTTFNTTTGVITTVSGVASALTISSITPNNGLNSGSVNISNLAGTNFQQGASVKLTKTSQTDISCTSVSFVSTIKLTATCNLTSAADGLWNVKVINPDTQNATLSDSFTISGAPSAPVIGTATAGNTQATVTFTAPVSDGGSTITGYTVTSSPAGGTDSNAGTTGLSHIVTGLTNGTAYTFTVTATNAIGTGSASAASNSVTPVTVPGAPTIGTATAGNTQATITFTAPASDGGSAITGYTVTSSPAGGTDSNAGTTGLSHIVTGLTNGATYTFTVTATTAIGTGSASAASNSIMAGPLRATGGTITYTDSLGNGSYGTPQADGFVIHTFTTDGTFAIPYSSIAADILTVGGGGGGGQWGGGGGGAGGLVYYSTTTLNGSFSIAIGTAGGISAQGGDTTFGSIITARGGGYGNSGGGAGVTGGSGGGGGYGQAGGSGIQTTDVGISAISRTYGFGNGGGTGLESPPCYPGGGGGGAGGSGGNYVNYPGGAGGLGKQYSISGSAVWYAAGGGGGNQCSGNNSVWQEGSSGGGYSGYGGGGNSTGSSGAYGGYQGIVIIKYRISDVPSAPIIGTATAGNTQATVTFTAPVSDGGSTITGYTVTSSPAGGTDSNAGTTGLSHIVTGLTNGTAYTFTVTATNEIGTSPASSASNSITPWCGGTIAGAGGATTYSGGYTIHTFTSGSGSFTPSCTSGAVDYLIIAGGGGGGNNQGGGGGAGGYLSGNTAVTVQEYTITVGAGGAAGYYASVPATVGSNSSALGFTASGGGRGGNCSVGGAGGSGGGGSTCSGTYRAGGSGTAGPPRQGYDGGDWSADADSGAGGGGAGGAGAQEVPGAGTSSSISGASVCRAGGGGGGMGQSNGYCGTGTCGGGSGSCGIGYAAGGAGTANTGGGGGGGANWQTGYSDGGAGGSGIVIISYPTP